MTDQLCIGIVSPWPKVKNAEFEVIERMKFVIQSMGHKYIVIDSEGIFVEGTHSQLDDQVTFVISMHFISAKLWFNYTYYAVWNPVRFYHDAKYEEVMNNVLSYDDYLLYPSQPMKRHLLNFFRGTNKNMGGESEWVAGCSGPLLKPSIDQLKNAKLFYVGINWEKISNKNGRHHSLLKKFDKAKVIRIFGPRKFAGVRPWAGFDSYEGDIPFDGHSLIEKLHDCGISLVLSSEQHRLSEACSSRIYESCHAGTVIISDRNTFVTNQFADRVLYFTYGKDDEETYQNIMKQVNWVKDNPEKALELAKSSQQLYVEKYSMEQGLRNIIKNHPKRLEVFNKRHLPLDKSIVVDVVIPWLSPNIKGAEKLLQSISQQSYLNINIVILCDTSLKNSWEKLCQPTGKSFEVHEVNMFVDAKLKPKAINGVFVSEALKRSSSDYFILLNQQEQWSTHHVSCLLGALQRKPNANVSISGSIVDGANSSSTHLLAATPDDLGEIVGLRSLCDSGSFLFRNSFASSDIFILIEQLFHSFITPMLIEALKETEGIYAATNTLSSKAKNNNEVKELDVLIAMRTIGEFYRLDLNYRKLVNSFVLTRTKSISFWEIRKVTLEFIKGKLRQKKRLFAFSKYIYKKFICRFIY